VKFADVKRQLSQEEHNTVAGTGKIAGGAGDLRVLRGIAQSHRRMKSK
jgi:hypothetical protein